MACDGYTKVWDLTPGEIVGLDGARGTTLRVTRGTLWLTFERDSRDVVLAAGDVFTVEGPATADATLANVSMTFTFTWG